MTKLTRRIRDAVWTLNGYYGRTLPSDVPQKATVLITYYHPARMKYIEPQIRNVLKCGFVDKLIISSHNPDIKIECMVKIKDGRLTFVNQDVRRGCGYRWSIADAFNPEYLVVIDDDILLFPSQLAKLFKHLVAAPEIPHGLSGMLDLGDQLEYHERENMSVDFLCEVYAVTRKQLKRYTELEKLIAENSTLAGVIESSADFMIISQTGSQSPKIHDVGRVARSDTFNQPGVAVHKDRQFGAHVIEVSRAIKKAGLES